MIPYENEADRLERRARIDAAQDSFPTYLAIATQEELERLMWDERHMSNVYGRFSGTTQQRAKELCAAIAQRAIAASAAQSLPATVIPDLDKFFETWDALDAAVRRILSSQPADMTSAAERLEAARQHMHDAVLDITKRS